MTHPFRSLGRLAAVGTSVARLMAPSGRPVSPIMTGRSFRRHVEIIDLELAGLKRAATTWGGTVNDVFVASVVRGLTLYHAQHGVVAAGFRALMPVNVRDGAAGESGNHFVPARFVIAARPDLAGCMAEVRRNAAEWKHAPGLAVSDVLATGLSALPRGRGAQPVELHAPGQRLLHHQHPRTAVPGRPGRRRCGGHLRRVTAVRGGAQRLTHLRGKRACITITADVAAVPDSPKLAGCIEDGFAEVCSAAPPDPVGSP